jgi:hypothetical protein
MVTRHWPVFKVNCKVDVFEYHKMQPYAPSFHSQFSNNAYEQPLLKRFRSDKDVCITSLSSDVLYHIIEYVGAVELQNLEMLGS